MCFNCDMPCGKRFGMGVLGVFLSLMLFLLGMSPPLNGIFIRMPFAWLLALMLLVLSVTVYYDAKDKFWASVEEKHRHHHTTHPHKR